MKRDLSHTALEQEDSILQGLIDGKLSINFESSFQSPETKPTSQTIGIRKVKRNKKRKNEASAGEAKEGIMRRDKMERLPPSSMDDFNKAFS